VGEVRSDPILVRVDSPENILANRLSALLSREAPRDMADIWGLCTRLKLSIQTAIEGAQSKAAGIYPPTSLAASVPSPSAIGNKCSGSTHPPLHNTALN
jgi:hypothetical protein